MSTTLIPPSYYRLTLPGGSRQLYATPREAAAAIVASGRRPAEIMIVTGVRCRPLSDAEACELRSWVAHHRHPVPAPTIPYPRRHSCT